MGTPAKTTLDVYGHLSSDGEDRTRAAIDAEFGAPQGPFRPGQEAERVELAQSIGTAHSVDLLGGGPNRWGPEGHQMPTTETWTRTAST